MFAPPMNIWNWKPFLKLMRLVLRVLFRFRAYNEKAAEVEGPVLLIPNHLSWIDWLFTGLCLDTDWKFVASSVPARHSKFHAWVLSNPRIFLIDNQSPYAVKEMAAHLKNGGKLVLFAEGRMSRTGTLQRLFEGTGFLLQKTGAKVITCHLRGAQRVLASPHRGWKRWFPKVSTHFSDPAGIEMLHAHRRNLAVHSEELARTCKTDRHAWRLPRASSRAWSSRTDIRSCCWLMGERCRPARSSRCPPRVRWRR